jgi:hypothetical protein
MSTLVETRLATLERVSPDLLEIRFKPDQKLDNAGLREILQERERMCTGGPYAVLAVFPQEMDFEINVMTTDHYAERNLGNCTRALALAANSITNEHIANIYYAYFPQPFNTKVFATDVEARKWLLTQLSERSMS